MDNGLDRLLNELMPKLIERVKSLEGRVAELEGQKEGIQMFLDQLCPKLVEKIKALEEGAAKPKAKRGRKSKVVESASEEEPKSWVCTEPTPPRILKDSDLSKAPEGFMEELKAKTAPDSVFTIEDIRKLAEEGKTVEKDKQLWYFNGRKATAREFGFDDILDLPFKERLAAFKERGFVTADGSIPAPAYGG